MQKDHINSWNKKNSNKINTDEQKKIPHQVLSGVFFYMIKLTIRDSTIESSTLSFTQLQRHEHTCESTCIGK